jgi:hypothetical protein
MAYIQKLQDLLTLYEPFLQALSATLLPWLRDNKLLPFDTGCFTPYVDAEDDYIVHPAQLSGWELAEYMRCVIDNNRLDWIANGVTTPTWNNYMMQYLPDLNPTDIVAIDPFDPEPFTSVYLTFDDCEYDQEGALLNPPCKQQLSQEIWQLKALDYLPYLPASLTTATVEGREALAQATWDLWKSIGIFSVYDGNGDIQPDVEAVARWINANEHGIVGGISANDKDARQDLLAFIHYTYWRNIPPGKDRFIVFLSAWSVALFQLRNGVNDRTYLFLDLLLTPTELLAGGMFSEFANDPSMLDWGSSSASQYSSRIQGALNNGATRTFGSSELDAFTPEDRTAFREAEEGVLWVIYISNSANSLNGVYLMTTDQFNYAQSLKQS